MPRNLLTTIVYVMIGLAVIGLLFQLFSNPGGFITGLLISIGITVALISLLYIFFFKSRTNSTEAKKYRQAVKQSKNKYKKNFQTSTVNRERKQQTSSPIKRRKHRRTSHLRVIDGNKSKNKKAGL